MNLTILKICVVFIGSAFLVSACGQKGALYLPNEAKNGKKQRPSHFMLYQNNASVQKNEHSQSLNKEIPNAEDF